jgi:pilus assembly protein CpaF
VTGRPDLSGSPAAPTAVAPVGRSAPPDLRTALTDVRARLAGQPAPPTAAAVASAVREVVGTLGGPDPLATHRALTAELIGAGPLEPLLADPAVTDVLVNGPGEVWVDRGCGLERTPVRFPDDDVLRRLAVRLAAAGGRRLDTAMPYTDARMPDGTRLHAVLPPVAVHGTCLSLRRPRRRPFSLEELQAAGTLDHAMAAALRAVVHARLATMITGGTGTGKSTLLAALLAAVPAVERIVLIEDTAELVLHRTNLVRLEGRPPNIEGAGEITQRDLVRQALRMRPDRLVVGEIRGAEILDLLIAFNTGHEGGLSTVHANSAGALPTRLEALGALAGLPRAALHSHLAAALRTAVHLWRGPDGHRRVGAIGVLHRAGDGLVRVVPAVTSTPPPTTGAGPSSTLPAEGLPILRDLLRDRGTPLPAELRDRTC